MPYNTKQVPTQNWEMIVENRGMGATRSKSENAGAVHDLVGPLLGSLLNSERPPFAKLVVRANA